MRFRRFLPPLVAGIALAAGLSAAPPPAVAQAPAADVCAERTIRFIVGFPAGGSVDTLARLVQPRMAAALGRDIVVENRSGASGSVAAGAVAQARPDGCSWLFVFDTHVTNPFLIPRMPYDTVRDLAPVMLVATAPMALVAHPATPYRSFRDFIDAAKANPNGPNFATIGNGSLGHLAMMLLQRDGQFRATHVPYRGGAPARQDVLAGHVQTFIGTTFVVQPNVAAGQLRPLVVTGARRVANLPDVPTAAESGFPGFEAYAFWGVLARAGTPEPMVRRFHAALAETLNEPDMRTRLAGQGMDLVVSDGPAFARFIEAEMEKWGRVIRENDIKADP